jgi:hypothetical protein
MNKENTFISLDFDGSLHQSLELQEFVKELVEKGYYVGVTTRRSNIFPNNPKFIQEFPTEEVYELAKELEITTINFLHLQYKHEFLDSLYCNVVHIDDDVREVAWINQNNNKQQYIGMEKTKNVCFHISELDKFKQFVNNIV